MGSVSDFSKADTVLIFSAGVERVDVYVHTVLCSIDPRGGRCDNCVGWNEIVNYTAVLLFYGV